MGDLERLGQSDAWAWTMLRVLELDGWAVASRPALGSGYLIVAARGNTRVSRSAATLVDAARAVFEAATRARRAVAA